MGDIGEEELMNLEQLQGTDNGKEEKILVLVRLRPLNEKEIAHGEVGEWECINSTTILYRNSLQERSGLPTAYSFGERYTPRDPSMINTFGPFYQFTRTLDKVFRGNCSTREVYQAGTKDIALSVVGGINSTIFAYGQTSSGKTYTMNGVTEYAVADIYDYIQRHEERAFALKFSAMEIYNEVVRDLLSMDSTPLRLLDDPERGTVIEKLTEETLRDQNHLKELLCICEAQRQIGETSLNETSSRSHQILRLTIESSAREFLGKSKSTTLSANVNFVDLAGSERASQASSVGQRLKEGCHINRSLLTLGTVIRKLSKGRHGHINYRDSKLTRILQPALGGNARTAIICTLCPARSHIEQSRNTLLFASCAKEVSTNAQVNIVMSDKALVKHLQKEVARLEGELRIPGSICDHAPMLRKKDMQIEQMENEVKELKKQLSFAHTRIEDLIRATESHKSSQKSNEILAVNGDFLSNEKFGLPLSKKNRDRDFSDVASDPNQAMGRTPTGLDEDCDDICKEVRCIEIDESGKERYESFGTSTHEEEEIPQTCMNDRNDYISVLPTQVSNAENGNSYSTQDQRNQDVPTTINTPVSPVRPCWDAASPYAPSSGMVGSGNFILSRSQSCRANLMTSSPDSEMAEQKETTPSSVCEKNFTGRPESGFLLRKQWTPVTYGANTAKQTGGDSPFSDCSSIVDEMRNQHTTDAHDEIPTLGSFVAGLRQTAKLQRANWAMDQVKETQSRDDNTGTEMILVDSMNDWSAKFTVLRKSILELWHDCYVSLIHRTYFVLLVKDDSSDSIYMEVEHRRLSFLKDKFSRGNSTIQDGRTLTLASSKKALRQEREMLSRLMHKRYTHDERNRLYNEWGISLNSKKRRLQLVHLLWSNTQNMDHVRKSTTIVAKLIGFSEHGQAPKEMFGLCFAPPTPSRISFSWKNSMPSLR